MRPDAVHTDHREDYIMNLWLRKLKTEVPFTLKKPAEVARFELENNLPGFRFELCEQPGMGDTYRIESRGTALPRNTVCG